MPGSCVCVFYVESQDPRQGFPYFAISCKVIDNQICRVFEYNQKYKKEQGAFAIPTIEKKQSESYTKRIPDYGKYAVQSVIFKESCNKRRWQHARNLTFFPSAVNNLKSLFLFSPDRQSVSPQHIFLAKGNRLAYNQSRCALRTDARALCTNFNHYYDNGFHF